MITNCVIGDPPLSVGATITTVALPSPRVALVIVGAAGGPTGVTEFELFEIGDDPAALFATTVKLYVVELLRPLTVQLVAPAGAVHVAPPGEAVTVYPVIAAPPSLIGAVNETVALESPATAVMDVGASGADAGVAVTETVEDSESPTPLVAMTLKV